MQTELLQRSTEPGHRTLLSSHFQPGTPKRGDPAASAGFLGTVPGRQTLVAAGDRLRDLIVPDALAQAVSVVGAGVGVGGGPKKKKRDPEDGACLEVLRQELDELIAAVCPLCEGSVAAIDKPFVREDENVSDWAI
jgi:hypothetical protein